MLHKHLVHIPENCCYNDHAVKAGMSFHILTSSFVHLIFQFEDGVSHGQLLRQLPVICHLCVVGQGVPAEVHHKGPPTLPRMDVRG